MAIGDVWRLSLVGDWGLGNQAVVTLHFKDLSGVGTIAGLVADLKTRAIDNWKGLQADEWYWRQVNANTVNVTPPLSQTITTAFPIQGTDISDSLPQPDAAISTLRTAYAGRSYRGRYYLPAICDNRVTRSTIDAGTLTALQGVNASLLAQYGASGADANWRLVVWSKKKSVATDVNSITTRDILGTQRRRRPGVGS